MKIIPFDKPFLDTNSSFMLGDRKIGATNSIFVIDEKERKKLIRTCKKIWEKLVPVCNDFTGLIRYDLVPYFLGEVKKIEYKGKKGYDIGELELIGVYEINDRSPECPTAVSSLHNAKPILRELQPSAAERFAEVIKEVYGDEEIVIVRGKGFVKSQWGEIFFKDLKKAKLKLSINSEEQFIKSNSNDKVVYLYGDYRDNRGPSEFSSEFMDYIKDYPRKMLFNSIPYNGFISDKSLLFPIGEDWWDGLIGKAMLLNSEEKIDFILENKDKWVWKKALGSSGIDVYMGRLMFSIKDCEKSLRDALKEGGYAVFEAKWLPKIKLPFGNYAIDVNVAFWATGKNLKYLYTISRIDNWKTYWNRGVINVTQGAGFCGTLVEEE